MLTTRVDRQGGFALLALLTILVLALTTALVTRYSVNQRGTARVVSNAAVLGEAAAALTGYALRQVPPGTLPCPDIDGDGIEDRSAADCQSARGLLPVNTIDAGPLTDSSGASLWYAVELDYVENANELRNPSQVPALTLDGRAAAAIIIAPGQPVYGQDRSPLVVGDFLEGINADANLTQFQSLSAAVGNDQLLALDAEEFWTLMARIVLEASSVLLAEYRNQCGEYPWAAPFGGPYDSVDTRQSGSLPVSTALPADWGAPCGAGAAPALPGWLATHWGDQLFYRMCQSAEASCLQVVNDAGIATAAAVLLSPGTALAGQVRPSGANQYFEGENIAAPDSRFEDRRSINHTATYNDVTYALVP